MFFIKKISKIKFQFTVLPFLMVLAMLLPSCEKNGDETPTRSYSLVWNQEFDGLAGEVPDSSVWNYDIGTGNDGWGNQELQYYTNSTDNIALDGLGNLAITARAENFGGSGFTSGRINTKDKFDIQYGRIEASIKLPYGPGIWPAFWMLGNNIDELSWPQCGEIDIVEFKGQIPNTIYGSVHGPGYSAGNAITTPYRLVNERFDTDFRLYAVEWGVDGINFFVDDYLYAQIDPEDVPGEWVFNQSFFLILNVAVGGGFVGFPTSGTPFPQTMLVDYIRVYEEQ
jgi:beta-glucanase (GH16 family)